MEDRACQDAAYLTLQARTQRIPATMARLKQPSHPWSSATCQHCISVMIRLCLLVSLDSQYALLTKYARLSQATPALLTVE